MWMKVLGIVSVDFDMMNSVLERYSAAVKYLKKWEYSRAVRQVFTDLRKACDLDRSKVWRNIPAKFIITKRLNESCGKSG